MSEFVLAERPYIKKYHKFLCIVQPIFALILLLMVLFTPINGLSIIYILLLCGLLVNTLRLLTRKQQTITFSKEGIKGQGHYVLYEDVDNIFEINNSLHFISKGEKFLVLNEFRYEPDDLIKMNSFLEEHHLGVGETVEQFALSKIDNEKVSAKIFIILSIIAFIYLLALGNDTVHAGIDVFILSLLIPLVLFAYYSYLLYTNQIKLVKDHRAGFLLAMLFPTIIGYGAIYLHYTTGGVAAIVKADIFLFIAFLLYYCFANHLRGQGNDYLYLVFVIIYIPLALIFANVKIPAAAPVYETHTIASVNMENMSLTSFYDLKYITSVDHRSTVIADRQGKGKKVGDRVTINVKKGLFNIYSDDEKVTITKISKIDSGYQIHYNINHYNRIMITEKEALSLKAHQKVRIRVRTGIFGVKDYHYVK